MPIQETLHISPERRRPTREERLARYDKLAEIGGPYNPPRPHVIFREKDGQCLVVIGGPHSYHQQNAEYPIIRNTFDVFRSITGDNNCMLRNEGKTPEPTGDQINCINVSGERGLLADFSRSSGIPLDTWDNLPYAGADILLADAEGFAPEHILYYFILRQIPGWYRSFFVQVKNASIDAYLEETINKYKAMLMASPSAEQWKEEMFSLKAVKQTHDELFPDYPDRSSFYNLDFCKEQTVNFAEKDTVVQRISRSCNVARDEVLDEIIFADLEAGKSVFVIGGWEHAYAIEPELERWGTAVPIDHVFEPDVDHSREIFINGEEIPVPELSMAR